ncbi:hypothetical protein BO70DRAFT_208282 [Aspergillus heteromorphus CBS 117.55]|uniref:Serine-threonine rich protein n=1 Tax=Aspergillus heteromorphus CBS 117.55 TaxID=1448321 RepID=A0A317USH3_9EURO|nr:uncharacterized protein BO70DRAFT_208282 [Aspergillus heteromorphus CBS 117.55]PWY64068.1 hypothetical protein BO70DRAFT_208282 [Aspergillus heteromorphus CBS 117.55]
MIHPVAVSDIRAVRWSTALTGDRPHAILFSSSRLLKSPSSFQCRRLWRCTHERHNYDHLMRQMDKHNRFYLSKLRDRPARPPRQAHTVYEHHHPWWNRGCESHDHKPRYFEIKNERAQKKDFWEAERTRLQQKMNQIHNAIEKDPYAAIFGRRLGLFGSFGKLDNTLTSLCRSFLGLDKSKNAIDTTARSKSAPTASRGFSIPVKMTKSDIVSDDTLSSVNPASSSRVGYEFDPISGRMILRDLTQSDVAGKTGKGTVHDAPVGAQESQPQPAGYMSPVKHSTDSGVGGKASPERLSQDDGFAVPVADENVQKHEVQEDESSPAQEESRNQSTVFHKGSNGVFEDADGPPEAIIVESSKAQNTVTPESAIDNGIHEQLDLPGQTKTPGTHFNDTMASKYGNQGYTGPSSKVPRGFLDSAQEPDRMRMEREEDLDLLSASDIRGPYYLKKFSQDPETKPSRKDLDATFDSHFDTVGTIDAESIRSRFQKHEVEDAVKKPSSMSSDVREQPDPQGLESPGTSKVHVQNEEQETIQCSGQTAKAKSLANGTSTEFYRVLAYDPTTLEVSEAETSTSFHTPNESADPAEVLGRLNMPAKFLPHFAKLHADGYEIVSGGGDILVFRKTHVSVEDDAGLLAHAVKGSLATQAEALEQSPSSSKLPRVQGRVDAEDFPDAPPTNETILSDADMSNTKRSKPESKPGKALRRMAFGGAVTAATCYAIGVVVEYFRTGGKDGRGIDGFTVFESERRHGD